MILIAFAFEQSYDALLALSNLMDESYEIDYAGSLRKSSRRKI